MLEYVFFLQLHEILVFNVVFADAEFRIELFDWLGLQDSSKVKDHFFLKLLQFRFLSFTNIMKEDFGSSLLESRREKLLPLDWSVFYPVIPFEMFFAVTSICASHFMMVPMLINIFIGKNNLITTKGKNNFTKDIMHIR